MCFLSFLQQARGVLGAFGGDLLRTRGTTCTICGTPARRISPAAARAARSTDPCAARVDVTLPSAGIDFLSAACESVKLEPMRESEEIGNSLPIRFAQPVTGAKTSNEAPACQIAANNRAMQAPTTSPHPETPPETRRMPWGSSSLRPSSRFQDGVTPFRIVTSHKG